MKKLNLERLSPQQLEKYSCNLDHQLANIKDFQHRLPPLSYSYLQHFMILWILYVLQSSLHGVQCFGLWEFNDSVREENSIPLWESVPVILSSFLGCFLSTKNAIPICLKESCSFHTLLGIFHLQVCPVTAISLDTCLECY